MPNRKAIISGAVAISATLGLAWLTMSFKGFAAPKEKTANVCFQSLFTAVEPDSYLYLGIDSDTNDTILIGCTEDQSSHVDSDCASSVLLPSTCEIR